MSWWLWVADVKSMNSVKTPYALENIQFQNAITYFVLNVSGFIVAVSVNT